MNFAQHTFTVVSALALLTILGHIIVAGVVSILLTNVFRGTPTSISQWISKNGLVLMLIVALTAMAGSLFFSEVSGWAPCKYCWIQRIFMYPQVVLLAIALWKKDRTVARYILALSIIGALYAAYHYYIQMYDIIASPLNPATPCDASGESCVKTPFTEFGYITVPMMALTAFTLNILGSVLMLQKKRA